MNKMLALICAVIIGVVTSQLITSTEIKILDESTYTVDTICSHCPDGFWVEYDQSILTTSGFDFHYHGDLADYKGCGFVCMKFQFVYPGGVLVLPPILQIDTNWIRMEIDLTI